LVWPAVVVFASGLWTQLPV